MNLNNIKLPKMVTNPDLPIGVYEKMTHYDDIDSVYASNLIKQLITRYANTTYIDQELNTKTL